MKKTGKDFSRFYSELVYLTFTLISLAKANHMTESDARWAEYTSPQGDVSYMAADWTQNILTEKEECKTGNNYMISICSK